MDFGTQTVGFAGVTLGEKDPNGVRPKTRGQTNVGGCRFRPLRADETEGQVDISSEAWKCTAPPDAAVLAATAIDELVYDGTDDPQRGENDRNVYQIDGGILPFTDETGSVYKVTVIAIKKTG